jgi:hypothetical protein
VSSLSTFSAKKMKTRTCAKSSRADLAALRILFGTVSLPGHIKTHIVELRQIAQGISWAILFLVAVAVKRSVRANLRFFWLCLFSVRLFSPCFLLGFLLRCVVLCCFLLLLSLFRQGRFSSMRQLSKVGQLCFR